MATLGDIMTWDVVWVSPESTLREAIEILRETNVGGAPVLRGSRVAGVVSVADILDFEVETPVMAAEGAGQADWDDLEEEPLEEEEGVGFGEPMETEADLLSEHVVAEVMTRTVHALPPETDLAIAATAMGRLGIHRVLVMDGPRLLGIVTASDFVRAVAERRA